MKITQKYFKKFLTQLKKRSNSKEAESAIDKVLKLEKNINFDDDSAKSYLTKDDFEIPLEISSHPQGFALFSDGACRGNPGPGAWGMVGQNSKGEVIFHGSGFEMGTTNNQMELTGAINSIKALSEYIDDNQENSMPLVVLYSDSKYVVDGITKWVSNWKKKGWKKADNKAPENLELWQEFDYLVSQYKLIKFEWVKGHSGHPQNEYCDQLANEAIDEAGF